MKPFLCLFLFIYQFAQAQNNNEGPALKWKLAIGAPIIGSPVADDSCIYVGNIAGTLYAISKDKGKVKWKFSTYSAIRSTVNIYKDRLYLVSGDGNMYCLDKKYGKPAWVFHTLAGYMGDTQHDWADYYQSSPVFFNNNIYFGSGDGNVYAVNATDGALVWKYTTGGNVHTTPALYKDKLFIGSFDGYLYALNNITGTLIWKFKSTGQQYFPKGEMMGNPVVAGDLVFIGSRDYNLYAVDINGGYCHWMKQYPKGWALPVTLNDSVMYVGTSEDRQLIAMNKITGEEIWRLSVPFNIFGGCAINKNMGCFGTLMGKVYGVDLTTGQIQWAFLTDGYIANHTKYFNGDDGYLDNFNDIIGPSGNFEPLYNDIGAIFSTPLYLTDELIVTSADGNVYALQK